MSRTARIRSLILGGAFTLFFLLLLTKLYWVQVVDASSLMQKAEQNWNESMMLTPKRGMIEDRNGKVLAVDDQAFTVAVDPKLIHQAGIQDKVVQALAPILGMTDPQGLEKLTGIVDSKQSNGDYYVQREIRNEGWKIDSDKADKIRAVIKSENLSGIYLLSEQKRYYPSGSLAAHVLGYTNKDGKAIMGLEYYYNKILQGKKGSISYQKDAMGYQLPNTKVVYHPPVNGKTLQLTIDQNIQAFTEEALKQTYDKYQPKSAMAIVVDPQTMDVLAMANYPTFDPNQYWNYNTDKDFINRDVASVYEPGSTFKLVTLTGTVDQGLFHPNDTYQSGTIDITGQILRDYNDGAGWGKITYLRGLEMSSNVGFVKLGYQMLGPQRLTDYIDRFGFGKKTGIDLPGESSGIVAMHYPVEYATATYGQGKINVTPIQLAAAYAAIANGGKLMQPHVVKNIIDPATNKIVQSFPPKVVRQVVSPAVAKQVTQYLEQVVSSKYGTGRTAAIPGYSIAGKTGTASIVVNGKYADAENQYLLSFVGYAPAEHPRVEVLVMVERPKIASFHEGGLTTLPVFKSIMSNTLRYLGIPSDQTAQDQVTEVDTVNTAPNVAGMGVDQAKAAANQAGYDAYVLGSGQTVSAQFPEPGTHSVSKERMYLLTDPPAQAAFPDLSGFSLRDAMEVCSLLQVSCKAVGQGYVVSQQPSGSGKHASVTLTLQDQGADPSGAGSAQGVAGSGSGADSVPASSGNAGGTGTPSSPGGAASTGGSGGGGSSGANAPNGASSSG